MQSASTPFAPSDLEGFVGQLEAVLKLTELEGLGGVAARFTR